MVITAVFLLAAICGLAPGFLPGVTCTSYEQQGKRSLLQTQYTNLENARVATVTTTVCIPPCTSLITGVCMWSEARMLAQASFDLQ